MSNGIYDSAKAHAEEVKNRARDIQSRYGLSDECTKEIIDLCGVAVVNALETAKRRIQ